MGDTLGETSADGTPYVAGQMDRFCVMQPASWERRGLRRSLCLAPKLDGISPCSQCVATADLKSDGIHRWRDDHAGQSICHHLSSTNRLPR